jgi:16S rRNA (cytidine1402-2'-O)-methyltransferase
MKGSLVLMPNALDLGADEVDLREVLPTGVIRRAAAIQHWAAEDARSTRAFIKRVGAIEALAAPLQAMHINELPKPRKGSGEAVPLSAWQALLAPALAGHDVGLLSEAGLPAVADPGAALVHAAHAAGLVVLPLAGPSSLLLALASSGLNGQSFAFVGYLPQAPDARVARLREVEAASRRQSQTQILIETPYRNAALMASLLATLAPRTELAVSCGLTLVGGWSRTHSVVAWRAQPPAMPDRWPAVFCFLAN